MFPGWQGYNSKTCYRNTKEETLQLPPDIKAHLLTCMLEVVPRVIMSPLVSSIGLPQCLLPESGWLIDWEFSSVPFRLPMSTSSHFNF